MRKYAVKIFELNSKIALDITRKMCNISGQSPD